MANGFLASSKLETSTANKEVVPTKPSNWTKGYEFKSFSFVNSSDCTVLVNNKTKVFLRAGQGFNATWNDPNITSFKVVEANIEYNWIGVY